MTGAAGGVFQEFNLEPRIAGQTVSIQLGFCPTAGRSAATVTAALSPPMKKSIHRLTIRRETVPTLRPLDLTEATPVRGGDGAVAPRFESTGTCPGAGPGLLATPACS